MTIKSSESLNMSFLRYDIPAGIVVFLWRCR